MDTDTPRGIVSLDRSGEARVASGHLWVFAGEIAKVSGPPGPGDLVEIRTSRGRLWGHGFYNPHSKIRVRLLTAGREYERPIDHAFWEGRLRQALDLRRRVVTDSTAYRVVHAEGDLLPGLIVDRYADVLVMQTLSYGMDARKELLADLLVAQSGARRVYLRNDTKSRQLEGLPLVHGFLRGEGETEVEVREGPATFLVDVARGQKTGWYCDQRENRAATARLASGARVLEAFCHTGAFGVHAALAGAASVLGIDSSGDALKLAQRHAELNHVGDRCVYREADVFGELPRLERSGEQFDLVILDPPAFAQRKHVLARALAGYKEVNLRALRLLRAEGFLVTCSCSQHVSEAQLWETVLQAARDAGRQVRLIERRSQAKDHPGLGAMPETLYLKCFLAQVL